MEPDPQTMTPDPILIVGTERSGSNLLRLVLNSHSRIQVPHPPHLVRYFAPIIADYGDLSQDENLLRLAEDAVSLVSGHIYRWEHRLDPRAVAALAEPRDLLGVYFAVMELDRRASGKARSACKSTFMVHHIDTVRRARPGARFLFLHRDPRDVAASARRSVFSTFHPWYTANLWREEQALGLRALGALPAGVILPVAYEALVAAPERELRRICDFLGEAFEPAMLRHAETAEAQKSAGLAESWARTGEPISAASVSRYRADLSEREIGLVEYVTRHELLALGYVPEVAAPAPPSAVELARFAVEERAAELRVELRSLRKDDNVAARWRRGAWLKLLRWRAALRGRSTPRGASPGAPGGPA
jgi:hypothetical protein